MNDEELVRIWKDDLVDSGPGHPAGSVRLIGAGRFGARAAVLAGMSPPAAVPWTFTTTIMTTVSTVTGP